MNKASLSNTKQNNSEQNKQADKHENRHCDLIFIAEDTIQENDFTNFGFVYANYVFATDKDDKPKALSFSWTYDYNSIKLLIRTLFSQTSDIDLETYLLNEQGRCRVFDLTAFLPKVISSTEAEKRYPDWIKHSKRQDVFDEFCGFMGLVDYVNRHKNSPHLILSLFVEEV